MIKLIVQSSGPKADSNITALMERFTEAFASAVGADEIVEGIVELPNCFSPEDFDY